MFLNKRRLILALIPLALAFPCFAAKSDSKFYNKDLDVIDYFKMYEDERVAIQDSTRGRGKKIFLLNIARNELEVATGVGREKVYYPMETIKDYKFRYIYPKEFKRAIELIQLDNHDQAVPLLRKYVYPLARFMSLPNEVLNVHELVKIFVDALVKAKYADEAGFFMSRLPLAELDPEYFEYALTACEQLVAEDRKRLAYRILGKVTYEEKNAHFFPVLMRFAKIFRQADLFEESLYIYQQISRVKGTPEELPASLWVAYCQTRSQREETARMIIERLPDIPLENRFYGLLRLVQARLNMVDEDFEKTILSATESVVTSDISDDWASEILFVAGQSYEHFSMFDEATSIYKQVELFFPVNPWGIKSKERLEMLSKRKLLEGEDDSEAEGPSNEPGS